MLKLDYKDDELDLTANTARKYSMTQDSDGYVSLEDKTQYSTTGDEIGAAQFKEIVRSLYGFNNSTIAFNDDGTITETMDIGTKTTAFESDGSITETITDKENNKITKETAFNEDGSITVTVGNVTTA